MARRISTGTERVSDAHNFGIILHTRELFVAPSEQSDMIDDRTAHRFIRNLQILNDMRKKGGHRCDPILVHFMSCGGCWDYGMAMYDAIKNSCDDPSLSNIVCLSYAHARSMSSIIPQAAKWRVIMPTAYVMLHDGGYEDEGNYKSVKFGLKFSERVVEPRMMQIYVEKCVAGKRFENWTAEKIQKHLEEKIAYEDDFYLTAREAVDYGLMDAVLGDEGFETIKQLRVEDEEEEE